MADTVVSGNEDKLLVKFVHKLKDYCRSFTAFSKKVEIDRGHISKRAAVTNQDIRNVVIQNRELIASLIINGELVKARCRFNPPIEAVFEGTFCNISTYNPANYEPILIEKIPVRIIARENRPKHLIVSVHEITDREDTSLLPEVPKNVW
jgi:hypothetical protein